MMFLVIMINLVSFLLLRNKKAPQILKRILSTNEMEEAREYAAMFGLDNEALNVDIKELIEIGRKYKTYLGEETIKRIAKEHHEHHNFYATFEYDMNFPKSKPLRHRINMMIREHRLVVAVSHVAVSTKIITGGNKDGEPSSDLF